MLLLKKLIKKIPFAYILYFRWRYFELEQKVLKPFLLKEKGMAIDIGANEGAYTVFLRYQCKFKKIVAFEPIPELYQFIKKCFKHTSNEVEVYNIGLSDKESTLELNIPKFNRGDGHATFNKLETPHDSISVSVKTLDSFNFTNVSFIKIDVEGYEDCVLLGAKQTIIQNKPIMLIEIARCSEKQNKEIISTVDVVNFVNELGYKCYAVVNGSLSQVDESDILNLQKEKNRGTPKFVYNFIFFPKDI
ncbi:MAG: FkbM family methyltransferase [Oscillospiraceae bacterium]|jgi:FkbM family methyltransferase|nr:FkbM family methyltransferase [Oscillospiraceae bacterium]